MSPTSHRAGLTLVEVAVALTLTVIVLAVLTQVVRTSQQLSSSTLTLGRLEEAAGQSVLAMASELRWARADTLLVTTEAGSDRVDFVTSAGHDGTDTVWSTTISYLYEPTTDDVDENGVADEGRLVRLQDGVRRILCRSVPSGGLSIASDGDTVELGLSVKGLARDDALLRATAETSVTLVNRSET